MQSPNQNEKKRRIQEEGNSRTITSETNAENTAPNPSLVSPSSKRATNSQGETERGAHLEAPSSKLTQKSEENGSHSFITSSPQPRKKPRGDRPPLQRRASRNLDQEFAATENQLVEESTLSQDSSGDTSSQDSKRSSLTSFFSPNFTFSGHPRNHQDSPPKDIKNKSDEIEEIDDSQDTPKKALFTDLASDEVLSEVSSDVPDKRIEPVYDPYAFDDDETEIEFEEFDPYFFIANLPEQTEEQSNRPPCLPPKEEGASKITLVLDLDETLVHCSTEPIPLAELIFPVVFNTVEYQVYVRKRPYFEEFLKRVSQKFEVVIFTASQEVYACKLLSLVDPENKYVKYKLYRDACVNVEGNYLKDLCILGRDLAKTVIVDNSPQAFGYQLENGIPIESWFDDDNDTELLKLIPFLESLLEVDDVRPIIAQKYKLMDKVKKHLPRVLGIVTGDELEEV